MTARRRDTRKRGVARAATAKRERSSSKGEPRPVWRRWLGAIAVAACAATLLSTFTWFRVMATDLRYRVRERDRELEDLAGRHRELTAEHERLTSPERLERIARQDLGLRPPAPGQVRRLP